MDREMILIHGQVVDRGLGDGEGLIKLFERFLESAGSQPHTHSGENGNGYKT